MELQSVCETCGRRILTGPPLTERVLVIEPTSWNQNDIFRLEELPALVYCTEKVKVFVEEQGFTNCAFRHSGVIPE
jgi:hypothetical protein